MTPSVPVLTPASTDDVVTTMHDLVGDGGTVAIIGAGTESRSVPPPPSDVVVELSRLVGAVDHQPDDLTVTVRSGTTLRDLDSVLAAEGQTAVLPELAPARTIGGIVAAGVSGYRRLRYGPIRDRVIGIGLVTGYGRAVRGGGRLVKNVTGYDLPRLLTGSRGGLGVITEVTLKLWPQPPASATIPVESAGEVRTAVYRPLAVLETHAGSTAFVTGVSSSVESVIDSVRGAAVHGLHWPGSITAPVLLSVRVPPRSIAEAITAARAWGATEWIAQHGVGVIDVGLEDLGTRDLEDVRREIDALSGVVVVDRWPADRALHDRFGVRADSAGVEDRLRSLFDPHGILAGPSRWERD